MAAGRLEGKVAIVTGAGSIGPGWGNGKATAAVFAREGATVFAVDHHRQAADEIVDLIGAEGGTASPYVADVSVPDDVARMVAECVARYGRVDVLHNNVGIGTTPDDAAEITPESWDSMMAIDLTSMFLTCREVVPVMLGQGRGAIVNVSSINSLQSNGRPTVSYGAAKAAVNQLTRDIAVRYADRGIRCNAVLPGMMATPMLFHYGWAGYDRAEAEALQAQRAKFVPSFQMGQGWDVAEAAAFLASDDASYVTGVLLPVDAAITAQYIPIPRG
jgi:NAD(P)-dependent dehydrogenase (short-subunit alcohol dehydrogenase family)